MTQIRLDAATLAKLAKFQDASGPVTLCDEAGNPVYVGRLMPADIGEPQYTEEELQAIEANPIRYTLDEAWEKIRRGEEL